MTLLLCNGVPFSGTYQIILVVVRRPVTSVLKQNWLNLVLHLELFPRGFYWHQNEKTHGGGFHHLGHLSGFNQ